MVVHTARKIWVDPPSGWQYGFPKIYDPAIEADPVSEWLIKNGMPEKYADLPIRCWYVEEVSDEDFIEES